MLLTWLVQVQDKVRMFTWIPTLTIKGKLLTQQFADISMEEVRAHAQMYQDRGTRDAQNAGMLIQCLKASISRKVYNKVYLQKEKYTIIRKNNHEAVEDGVCFLKSIIDNYYSNTRSSTKQIRKQLAQLNYYMRNVAKGDVSKLCEHTRELIYELNAAGETTNDLLENLIEALKEVPDVNFQVVKSSRFMVNEKIGLEAGWK
jgi:MinD-like ATPase involved in chromosome partitioning or flagellar assembly